MRIIRSEITRVVSQLFTSSSFCGVRRDVLRGNSNDAFISKIRRTTYVRQYPTLVVFPDGSTIHVRYHEPREIIRLPLKFEELSAEQQQVVLAKRRPPEKVQVQEEFDDSYDATKYLKLVKK